MQKQNDIDWAKIDWNQIDERKAEFIYNEGIARLDSIHKSIEGITNKALGMLSFSVPVLTALIGFFFLQWEELSSPLQAASVCSAVLLIVVFVLLLMILLPKGINTAQGEPSAYFSNNYYCKNMENIFKGNIQSIHEYINEDIAIMKSNLSLLRAAILSFTVIPTIMAGAWELAMICT